MKFTEYVEYYTRNNLKILGDVAFGPLETGLLFYGSVFVSDIVKGDGFSKKIQDVLDMT